MADNPDDDDDKKPAALSADNESSSKLDALAQIAAAENETSSVHSSAAAPSINQQPSEVTPANTYENESSPAVAAAAAAASDPPAASAAAASAEDQDAKAASSSTTTTANCPWKNRQDLQALWRKRYEQLVEYHRENQHTNVPQRYPANPELGRWVKDQRAFRRNNKLSDERIALLDELEFVWKIKRPDDFWKEKLEALKRYKVETGSVNPPREGEHKLLACWVDRQRRAGRRGKLTTERVRLLEELGFVWDPRGAAAGGGGDETDDPVSFSTLVLLILMPRFVYCQLTPLRSQLPFIETESSTAASRSNNILRIIQSIHHDATTTTTTAILVIPDNATSTGNDVRSRHDEYAQYEQSCHDASWHDGSS